MWIAGFRRAAFFGGGRGEAQVRRVFAFANSDAGGDAYLRAAMTAFEAAIRLALRVYFALQNTPRKKHRGGVTPP